MVWDKKYQNIVGKYFRRSDIRMKRREKKQNNEEQRTKKNQLERTRFFTQLIYSIVTNGYIQGFLQKTIFKGGTKKFCVPGMNCYSCPGAFGACPIGALQAVIVSIKYNASFYVGGMISLFGVIFGRFICGWLCAFGFIQDLLYRIPVPKLTLPKKVDSVLRYLKYVILVVFVLLLPSILTNEFGIAPPYFCEWICPVGTLEGGIPLVLLKESVRNTIGFIFYWKFAILIFIVVLSMFVYRPFCKYMCPLGTIYGIFNKVSIVRLHLNKDKCVDCSRCGAVCPMQVEPNKTPDSMECIRCGKCTGECPTDALYLGVCKKK